MYTYLLYNKNNKDSETNNSTGGFASPRLVYKKHLTH